MDVAQRASIAVANRIRAWRRLTAEITAPAVVASASTIACRDGACRDSMTAAIPCWARDWRTTVGTGPTGVAETRTAGKLGAHPNTMQSAVVGARCFGPATRSLITLIASTSAIVVGKSTNGHAMAAASVSTRFFILAQLTRVAMLTVALAVIISLITEHDAVAAASCNAGLLLLAIIAHITMIASAPTVVTIIRQCSRWRAAVGARVSAGISKLATIARVMIVAHAVTIVCRQRPSGFTMITTIQIAWELLLTARARIAIVAVATTVGLRQCAP